MKKITLLMAALVITMVAMAQAMSGTYKVGTAEVSPNFTSLSAAVTALNTVGVSGEVILEIASDITETVNIGLINNSNYSITIRPDQDVDRTITFNKATDNAGPSGAFCMGIGMGLAWADLSPTKNVIIDGYALGGTTRRLKITTAVTHHGGNGPILLMDDCSNIIIKNCIIQHVGASTGSSNYGIYLRVNSNYGTKKMPSNVLIENNQITCTQNTASQGIAVYANAAPTTNATNVVIKNNIINARTRGLFIHYLDGIDVVGNEFHINQTAGGVLSSAIMGNAGLTGNINVFANKFIELKTANFTAGAYGMRAIIASGGGTWYIQNNFFTGMDKTSTTAGETMLQDIRCGSTCYIRQNTFYLNSLTNKPTYVTFPTDTQGSYCGISIAAGTPEIKNNIFISNEDAVTNYAIRGTVNGESDNNVFYAHAGTSNTYVNSTYPIYSDYIATGKDVNSKIIDVNFVDAATGDLHIAGSSIDDYNMAAPMLTTVTTDMDGDTRTALTYIGADQASDLTLVAKQFKVTVPNGTPKVYVAGSFTGKDWNITDPFALKATGSANEFGAILPCVDGVEYKYLCEKGDWDYQEAVYDGANAPLLAPNRTYSTSDNVPIWFRVNKITLNATFATAVPNTLFVKGSFDSWGAGHEMTKSGSAYSIVIGGNEGDKYPANTEYKYYTNDMNADNWESNSDGSYRDNRWAIAPVMNDEIARFVTFIPGTGVDEIQVSARIIRTPSGIEVVLDGEAAIEVYSVNGTLLDKTIVNGNYSKALNSGIYIIRVNGVSTKFVK